MRIGSRVQNGKSQGKANENLGLVWICRIHGA